MKQQTQGINRCCRQKYGDAVLSFFLNEFQRVALFHGDARNRQFRRQREKKRRQFFPRGKNIHAHICRKEAVRLNFDPTVVSRQAYGVNWRRGKRLTERITTKRMKGMRQRLCLILKK